MRDEAAERDLIKRGVGGGDWAPAVVGGGLAGGLDDAAAIEVAELEARFVLKVDVDAVAAVGDGVAEAAAGEDVVAGEVRVGGDVAALADAEACGESDEARQALGGVGAEDVEDGADLAAALDLGVGELARVGTIRAADARAGEHVDLRAGQVDAPLETDG